MKRINETAAAKAYVAKLKDGGYPLDRSKNSGINYCEAKEARDTAAVREFTRSKLFEEIKKML